MIGTEEENAKSLLRSLQRTLASMQVNLRTIAKASKIIREKELWRHVKKRDLTPFTSFQEFVEYPLPDGLGCSYALFVGIESLGGLK